MKVKENKPVVWLQLTAGQGPKECGWVVAQLSRIVIKAATDDGLSAEVVEELAFDKTLRHQSVIEPDAFLSLLIRLEGNSAAAFARQWEGTIKWQGESIYRPKHKRVNWFVGAAITVMPDGQKVDISQLEKEINVDSMRSRGPGGQHVNRTNSAVRITHRPSGLQVRIESDRSQLRNKKIAIERLQILLSQQKDAENDSIERIRWLQHYTVQRGSPVRTFRGHEFLESN